MRSMNLGVLSTIVFMAFPVGAEAYYQHPNYGVVYDGGTRATGSARSWWQGGPYINLYYWDRSADGRAAYATAGFYSYQPWRNPVTGSFSYQWYRYSNPRAADIGSADGLTVSTKSAPARSKALYGTTAHGAQFSVCLNVRLRPDPCRTSPIHKY